MYPPRKMTKELLTTIRVTMEMAESQYTFNSTIGVSHGYDPRPSKSAMLNAQHDYRIAKAQYDAQHPRP